MRTKFKAWCEPYIKEHPEVMLDYELIPSFHDLYLEIGSGKGEFLIEMARKNPDITFYGIERNVTCAGITCKRIVESGLGNVKLIWDDAIRFFPLLKDETVEVLFLNFSDPWPKKRHEKRRLTSETFLSEYFRTIKKEGKLIFKTDNKDLFDYTKDTLTANNFSIITLDYDYDGLEEFDVITEYETRYRNLKQPIFRMVAIKNV